MVIDSLYGLNTTERSANAVASGVTDRIRAAVVRGVVRLTCGLQGHLILLHFEPTKLSLQCSLCGYQSEGWEVSRAKPALRVSTVHRIPREDRRRTLRTLDHVARLAS